MMVHLRLLGPVEIETDDGRSLPLGSGRIRTVAAALMSEVNQPIPMNRLIDLAWESEPPARARGVVPNHVHRLRRLLAGHAEIATRGQGYALVADPCAVDAHRFHRLVVEARKTEPPEAATLLRQALDLWRGEALADVPGERARRTLGTGLSQARLAARQKLGEELLLLGRYGELVTEATAWIIEHPLHEELTALLMRALQASGRQAEALDHYHRARRHLSEELGIDPGPALSQAYLAVLSGDRGATPRVPARPSATGPRTAPGGNSATASDRGSRTAPPPGVDQLPPALGDFCGRAQELAALDRHLDREPRPACVVLAGGGGVGKTTLAVQWAHQLKEKFPDGQLFADLRGFGRSPRSAGTVLSEFLSALGVPERKVPDSVQERAALYRAQLAGRRMLVLLDNAGTADQTRPLLPATPGSLAVVTSRRRLSGLIVRDGATLVTVGALTSGDALQLLGNALGRQRIEAEREPALALVEQCDHLPLALRIAAARLMAHPEWPLACWTQRLADERHRLHELSTHDGDLAVEANLYLSYRVLSSGAARLFRILGLHPGPCVGVRHAAALAGRDVEFTRGHLAELCDAHLLQEQAEGHYVRSELVRLYAARLGAAEEPRSEQDLAVQRLLSYLVQPGPEHG
ncbi:AfsR/SARP family transcriptional regulator [Streptomyces sp. 891-h]|uniref:AfsR/SARP family transcriptional regulator n=1 Tax=Streptomyces sp. 891-h TaxID=2720714 RepID=UPI001FAAC648|nr:AfsR/SARP family transcriptional regulator [Streptomyces sp. 891-h]